MNKINKSNFTIYILFLFLTTIVIFFSLRSLWYLMILIPIIIYFVISKISKKQWIWFLSLIIFVTIFSIILNYWKSNLNVLNNYLEKTNFYNGRQCLLNKIDNLYKNQYCNEFIKLLMFNEKKFSSDFYKNISNLGITYLFVISGMHINLLLFPFRLFFVKK